MLHLNNNTLPTNDAVIIESSSLTDTAAPCDTVNRVHNDEDEPFVIELRPCESAETLVIDELHYHSHTSLFGFMRDRKIMPIYALGEAIIQKIENKFNENLQRGFFQALMAG